MRTAGWLYFSAGDVFADRYVIIEEIGRGGMARVFKAEDKVLGIRIALKIIHPFYSANPTIINRFKQETLLTRSITHENVIRIYDIGEKDGIIFISMDYIKGQNLQELIQTSGFLAPDTAVNICKQVCRALAAAHGRGIVHRDLKPSNVMIDNQGLVTVMDFGLAKSLGSEETGAGRGFVGTAPYISPEQARGEHTDARS
ncbi:MAG: serine/threonine-protein kinase, partial [Candidatus Aminicenantaceae bacterium]